MLTLSSFSARPPLSPAASTNEMRWRRRCMLSMDPNDSLWYLFLNTSFIIPANRIHNSKEHTAFRRFLSTFSREFLAQNLTAIIITSNICALWDLVFIICRNCSTIIYHSCKEIYRVEIPLANYLQLVVFPASFRDILWSFLWKTIMVYPPSFVFTKRAYPSYLSAPSWWKLTGSGKRKRGYI